jgi:hypothetical protein
MVRNFFEMFLRARRALEFSHSQDQKLTVYLYEFVRSLMRSSSGRAAPPGEQVLDASGLGADSRDPFLHGPGDDKG